MGASHLKRVFALALAWILLCSLAACGSAGRTVRLETPVQPVQGETGSAARTSVLAREKQNRVSRSDMTVLYYDESCAAISVYDAGAKQLWRALPEVDDGADHAMLRARVLAGNAEYTLSSLTDCAKDSPAAQIEDGVLRLTFELQRVFEKTNVHLTVPLTFTAEDGTLRVEVDCASLKAADCGRDVTVLSLEVLPSFGAAPGGAASDFLFVPDGCGAVMATKNPAPLAVTLPVYGDPADPSGAAARVAVFGMKRGQGAFLALVQEGDALASVHAARPGDERACSTAGVSFAITPVRTDGTTMRLLSKPYDGKLTMVYRFLSEGSADAAGMAAACRELLVRSGDLDYSPKRRARTTLPLHVTLFGGAEFAVPGQGSYVSRHTVTTLTQAQDILSLLRSKGILEMDVLLRGFLRGDGKSGQLKTVSAEGRTTAADFLSFAAAQNAAVYPEVSALTATTMRRVTQTGETATLQLFSGDRVSAERTVSMRGGFPHMERLLRAVRAFPADGTALTDVGRLLAFDGANEGGRQALKAKVQRQLSMLFAAKPLTVSGGNLYALKFASAVTELPNRAMLSGSGYTAVPFLQMLLHGYCDYSGGALNLASDVETAFLRAAEYGEVPAIVCYYNDYSNADTPDNCSYAQAASLVQQRYERLNTVFADLGDKRITAHESVADGVFATTFGNTATVYVNYNEEDVTVHGVTVEARGILRVN